MAGLRGRGLPAFWATESGESKDRIGMTEDAIVVSTIHSAKGLEFPRVVTCGLTKRGSGEWTARNRNALYVGFTRAIDELAVVTTAASPYATALRAASAALCSAVDLYSANRRGARGQNRLADLLFTRRPLTVHTVRLNAL